ncbi:uncharacterized protein FFMR_12522 [Fusarium fujikuroi]|nr:uncharacterized protein FFMR_12522 [Fusarium fujikuroi]
MSESISYKDMLSPFSEGRFPQADAPVDPMKTTSRRAELKRFMRWFAPFWKGKINEQWHVAEQKVCEDFARSDHKSISQPWFEYEVDRVVYSHFIKLVEKNFKQFLKCDIAGWPWPEISAKDVTTQQDMKSAVYERYLKKQKVAAIAAQKNESAMEGVEGPAAETPSVASKLNPAAPAFDPTAEADTSEQAQTQAVGRGELRRRKEQKTKGLHDSMFSHPRGQQATRGRGAPRGRGGRQPRVHREPSPEDEYEWKEDDQQPSDQNNQSLGSSGPQVTEVAQQDAGTTSPLFAVDTLALTKKGIESSSFAPAVNGPPPMITNETMLENMSNNGSDHQKRKRVWETVYGNTAIREPIVGPFEMKIPDCIPTQVYISEERLAKANNSYLRDVQITFDRQDRRLTVGFAAKQGPGSFPSRMEIVNIWQAVKQWMQEVCSEIPSCLDDVIYRVLRKSTTISDEAYLHSYGHFRDAANIMPARLNEIGRQLPALREQLRPLLSADFARTRAGIEQWLNNKPRPYREIRAATAEWLMTCRSEDEANVIGWCDWAKKHIQTAQGEEGTELK